MSDKNNQGEVDLIQLFRIIGNAFASLVSFVKRILIFIYDLVIRTILFFRKNAFKIGIAILIGFGLGYFFETKKKPVYSSSMIVKPNFDSTRQLYTNISYFNELRSSGREEDLSLLSNIFQIKPELAQTISSISIEPILEENDKITHYGTFLAELDSIPSADVKLSFTNYTDNIPYYVIDNHKINVVSTDRRVFSKLQEPIINSVEENEFFKRRRKLLEANIAQSDTILKGQLKDLDSLKGIYREVLLKNADKQSELPSGTILSLGNEKIELPDEVRLLYEARGINDKLIELNEQRSNLQTTTVNVISDMHPIGETVYSKFEDKRVLFPLIFGFLTIALILLIEFNKYLNKYQNKE